MKKKIEMQIADPSGNITIFVRTPIERKDYQKVADQLLAEEDYGAEQVAFILPLSVSPDPSAGKTLEAGSVQGARHVDGAMEMCGLEFCGNASRAFGLILAQEAGEIGNVERTVQVSGCEAPLTVQLNMEKNRAKIRMPDPLSCAVEGDRTVVDFGGILHIIVEAPKAESRGNAKETRQPKSGSERHKQVELEEMKRIFDRIRGQIYRTMDPPALGVMFWDSAENRLTPVVYVKDVETTYFEGSCGSGTTACAAAFSMGKPDGVYSWSIPQPAGVIDVTAEVKDGRARAIYIDGEVKTGEIFTVEVEL